MKKNLIFTLTLVLATTNVFAASFSCFMESNPEVVVTGNLTLESASIQIKDEFDVLGIRELNSKTIIEMPRLERKKEDKYSFAKYYADFNAWQDIEISVPKLLQSKNFTSYLTIYGDNGDAMLPGAPNVMSCTAK